MFGTSIKNFYWVVFFLPVLGLSQEIITPVSIAFVSTELDRFNRHATNTIDGSGITDSPVVKTSTHDIVATNMWLSTSGDITPTIVFDMGIETLLIETILWNYNESGTGNTNRGVKQLEISVSSEETHSVTTSYFVLGTFDFTEGGTNSQTINTQAADVRLIKFTFVSNHGHASLSGLSEVRFTGINTLPVYINPISKLTSKKSYLYSQKNLQLPDHLIGQLEYISVFNLKGDLIKKLKLDFPSEINLNRYLSESGPFILKY